MLRGNWKVDLMRLLCFSFVLAGAAAEPGGRPPKPPPSPTFKITKKEKCLIFNASPPESPTQCWNYIFFYRKCSEETATRTVTESENWTAEVEYDAACKYTVQVQAKFVTKYCGGTEKDSGISEPSYFGEDVDPNLSFKVAIIVIPLIMCACFLASIVLFRRHKEMFFPKVPSPSNFFKDMFDNKNESTKGLYVRELYVPSEEGVEEIHVEPKIL